jgi:Homocysteine S-methyltransferase
VVSWFVTDETVLVADGGLATELEARGNDLSDSLWSARLLADAPGQILDAHLAFFRAGAVIATSASYQASFEGFARRGLDRGQAAGLMRRSVDLARAARDQMATDGRARWVAASAGPYGAALADGSEYRGRYGRSVRDLAAWHRPRLEVLAGAGPDVLALETVPDIDEAEALMTAVDGLGIPAWPSYSPRRRPHPRRAAAGRGVRGPRRHAGHRGGRGQLLHAGGRAGGHRHRPGGDGQAGDRVSQQRRAVGRAPACLDGIVPVPSRAATAVDIGRSGHHRRMLPGPARQHRTDHPHHPQHAAR